MAVALVLTTDRLVLNAHRPEDFDDCCALWSHPDVVRHIGGAPSAPPDVWARLLRYAGLWSLLGYGYWAVRERAAGQFVGELGFADFRRAMTPALGPDPEAGWVIAPAFQGRGYAAEALSAALAWADSQAFARTVCIISPANAPSLRLAARMGYRPRGEATMASGETTSVHERLNPQR